MLSSERHLTYNAPILLDAVGAQISALAFGYWFLWMTREVTGAILLGSNENYPLSQILGLLFALLAIAVQAFGDSVRVNWPACGRWIAIYFFWAGLSFAWTTANSPASVFLHWVEFGGDLLFICLSMSHSSYREAVLVSSLKAVALGGGCLAFYTLAIFRVGIDIRSYSLLHPNFLGHRIAIAGLASLFLWSRRPKARRWLYLLILLVPVLLLTTDKTSIIAFFITALWFLFSHPRVKAKTKFRIVVAFGCLLALTVPIVLPSFIDYVEGPAPFTLTGRLPLWIAVFTKILQRPWLGYGYGSFADNWPIDMWFTGSAHNEILQQWFTVGFIGVLIVAGTYWVLFRALHRSHAEIGRFGVVLLAYCLIRGMAEADDTHLMFALLFACALPRSQWRRLGNRSIRTVFLSERAQFSRNSPVGKDTNKSNQQH